MSCPVDRLFFVPPTAYLAVIAPSSASVKCAIRQPHGALLKVARDEQFGFIRVARFLPNAFPVRIAPAEHILDRVEGVHRVKDALAAINPGNSIRTCGLPDRSPAARPVRRAILRYWAFAQA